MARITTRIALLCAGVLLPAGAALADPPPMAPAATTAAAPALDPERLAIARQIIAIVMPPDKAGAMLDTIMDAILRQVKAQFVRQYGTDNPKAAARANEFSDRFRALMRDTMGPLMPDMAESMAHAYVHQFNRAELADILAFAQTPTGLKYLSVAPKLIQDPDVQAFYARMMPALQANQMKMLNELKADAAADAAGAAPPPPAH